MAIIKLSPQAEEDMYAIWHHIAVEQQSPINADKHIRQLNVTMSSLSEAPQIGTQKVEYLQGILQFPFRNYLVFYFPLNNGIEIIRVLHAARHLPPFFSS